MKLIIIEHKIEFIYHILDYIIDLGGNLGKINFYTMKGKLML